VAEVDEEGATDVELVTELELVESTSASATEEADSTIALCIDANKPSCQTSTQVLSNKKTKVE
jgi:hypothetical protein